MSQDLRDYQLYRIDETGREASSLSVTATVGPTGHGEIDDTRGVQLTLQSPAGYTYARISEPQVRDLIRVLAERVDPDRGFEATGHDSRAGETVPPEGPWGDDIQRVGMDIPPGPELKDPQHGPRDARLKSAAREKWGDEWYLETHEDADGDTDRRAVHTDRVVADGIVIRDYLTIGECGEIRQARRLIDTEEIISTEVRDSDAR